jgi:hypothetical protein
MERVKGIEPSSQAWEARILPLDHTRFADTLLAQAPDPRNPVRFVLDAPGGLHCTAC